MRKIFLDTCGILALINKRDSLHDKAKEINQSLLKEKIRFITTDYILAVVENALAKNKALAVKALKNLQESEDTEIVKIRDELFNEALRLYEKYTDKEWGFTDVSSFAVMKKLKISEAFTDDKHFE